MDPEYELIPQRSALNKEAYQIIISLLGEEVAHKTWYECWETIPIEYVEPFVFWVGDP